MPRSRTPLTVREQRFVEEYPRDLNASRACQRAGYSPKYADAQGASLLRRPAVAAALSLAAQALQVKAEVSATRTIEELRRVAFFDIRQLFDAAGNLKPIQDWTPEQGACVASFEVLIKNAAAGDGHTDTVHKFRLVDKLGALTLLCKHLGLVTERVEVTHVDALIEALLEGRRRAANRPEPKALDIGKRSE